MLFEYHLTQDSDRVTRYLDADSFDHAYAIIRGRHKVDSRKVLMLMTVDESRRPLDGSEMVVR